MVKYCQSSLKTPYTWVLSFWLVIGKESDNQVGRAPVDINNQRVYLKYFTA